MLYFGKGVYFWEVYPYKKYTCILLGETAGLEMNFSYNDFAMKVRQLRLFECGCYAQETALQFYLHRWDCPKIFDSCQSVNSKTIISKSICIFFPLTQITSVSIFNMWYSLTKKQQEILC